MITCLLWPMGHKTIELFIQNFRQLPILRHHFLWEKKPPPKILYKPSSHRRSASNFLSLTFIGLYELIQKFSYIINLSPLEEENKEKYGNLLGP